jgi:hypothetical protein
MVMIKELIDAIKYADALEWKGAYISKILDIVQQIESDEIEKTNISIEAYKSALRKAIEERIRSRYKKDKESQMYAGSLGALTMRQIFEVMDTVTPE